MNRRKLLAGIVAAAASPIASACLPKDDMVTITFNLTPADARTLRQAAAQEGITVDEFVVRALEEITYGARRARR